MRVEPSRKWGQPPPDNGTAADASGIVRSLLLGRYDTLGTLWALREDRNRWADFVLGPRPRRLRCFADADKLSLHLDVWFLVRPFSAGVWLVSLAIFGAFGLTYSVSTLCGVETRMAEGVASLLFVFVSAFYSGALLTVLVTKESLPFDTIREGLLSHPRWKMIVEPGNIYLFQNNFDLSDPVLRKAHEMASSDEAVGRAITIEEALKLLVKEGKSHFLYGTEECILSRSRPVRVPGLDLYPFCQPVRSYAGLIVPKFSPFKKLLDSGMLSLWEGGALDRIERAWFKGEMAAGGERRRSELSFSFLHLLLAFLVFLVGLLGVAALLALELCSSPKKKKRRNKVGAKVVSFAIRMTGK